MPVVEKYTYEGPPVTISDLVDGDPKTLPNWRWKRIHEIVEHRPRPKRNKPYDDIFVRTMREFILATRSTDDDVRKMAFFKYPGPYQAHELHRDPDGALFRMYVQSRLLARQTDEEIAKMTGLRPMTVEWYEKVYFNVRDRIDQHDWILRSIIGKEETWQLDNQEIVVKLMAYFGGVGVLNFMLSGVRNVEQPQTPEEIINYVSDFIADGMYRKGAGAIQNYTPNKYKIEAFLDSCRQVRADTKAKEDETDRLEVVASAVRHTLEAIRFIKGDMAEEWLKARCPKLLEYDSFPAELRDQQVYAVVSGNTAAVEHMRHQKFPEPPKREAKLAPVKDGSNEDPLEAS